MSQTKKNVADKLQIEYPYTVEKTVVHGWQTDVYLQEVEGCFNSVNFVGITNQPPELNINHPDFFKYE